MGSTKSRRDFRKIYATSSSQQQQTIRELCNELELSLLLDEVLNEPDELIG